MAKMMKRLGLLLMILAVLLIAYNVYDNQRAKNSAFQAIDEVEVYIEENNRDHEFYENMEMMTVIVDGNEYIGKLEIPSINISLPILSSWDYDLLKISPCLYQGSVYQNNMILAGHNYRSHFGKVRTLPSGTDLYFTDMEGRIFHYEVSTIEILKPHQVDELTLKDDWDLTLFSCSSMGSKRSVIRCKLIEIK